MPEAKTIEIPEDGGHTMGLRARLTAWVLFRLIDLQLWLERRRGFDRRRPIVR